MQSIPANLPEEQAAPLLAAIAATTVGLSPKQFGDTAASWSDLGNMLDALADLPPTFPLDRRPLVADAAARFTAAAPSLPDRTLAQFIRGFSIPGAPQPKALDAAVQAATNVVSSSRQDRLAVAAMRALQQGQVNTAPLTARKLLEHKCFEGVRVVRAQMALAAQRAGVLTEEQWAAVKAEHDNLVEEPEYSNKTDQECEALLRVAVARGDTECIATVVQAVLNWGELGNLRLWRAAPYVHVRAVANHS